MIIKSLNTMEKIVNRNNNLMWRGWDVIDLKKSDIAKTSPNGIRVNGEWYLHKIYSPSRNGWDVPNKYRE